MDGLGRGFLFYIVLNILFLLELLLLWPTLTNIAMTRIRIQLWIVLAYFYLYQFNYFYNWKMFIRIASMLWIKSIILQYCPYRGTHIPTGSIIQRSTEILKHLLIQMHGWIAYYSILWLRAFNNIVEYIDITLGKFNLQNRNIFTVPIIL